MDYIKITKGLPKNNKQRLYEHYTKILQKNTINIVIL